MSSLPARLRVSPNLRLVGVPASPVKVSGLFVSSYNCEPVTASFEFALTSPFDTPVIFLSAIAIPLALVTIPLTLVLVKSFKSLANLTNNLPEPSLFTPMLLSDNLVLSAPPKISKRLLDILCLITALSVLSLSFASSPA